MFHPDIPHFPQHLDEKSGFHGGKCSESVGLCLVLRINLSWGSTSAFLSVRKNQIWRLVGLTTEAFSPNYGDEGGL